MRCDECGYDYDDVPRADIASRIRALGPRYADALSGLGDAALRARPSPEVWSPLEYTCHMRDVLRTQRSRMADALAQDMPVFTPMGRERLVTERRYNEQDPQEVLGEVAEAADGLAGAYEELDDAGWHRTGVYTYPTREERTLEWVGVHTIHEGEHHLMDIARQVER